MQWSEINDYPDEAGIWSVVTAEDVHAVSRDWRTFSSERGGCMALTHAIPLELMTSMFIAMDPPKHDRIKALFQSGFTPKRIAMHEDEIRAITNTVLDRLDRSETCDIVEDIAQPVVSRVIGSFMGIEEKDDKAWATLMNTTLGVGDEDLAPGGLEKVLAEDFPEIFRRSQEMIDARRENPTDDLTSVLVHAEIDGETLADHEIVMGFFLLVAAGNDSTKATFTSGMNALLDHPEQMRELIEDPSLIPGAIEECLRMFPAFGNFRRTATIDTEIHGQPIAEGDKVLMWYVSSNRDEAVYEDPRPLRHPPQPRTPGLRSRWPALLSRHGARPARAEGAVRGDAEAPPRHDPQRRGAARRDPVPQPAQDPSGQALLSVRGSPVQPVGTFPVRAIRR